MRRDEREVCGKEEIFDILSRCDTVRIAMNGCDYPYVIPMTFGCELKNDEIIIYFHSAGAGRKREILSRNGVLLMSGTAIARLYLWQMKECVSRWNMQLQTMVRPLYCKNIQVRLSNNGS